MVLHLGFSALILEGDSLGVIDAIYSRGSDLSSQNSLILQIQLLLRWLMDHEVSLVGHEGNEAAHLLARHARMIDDTVQWYQCLDFLLSRVLLDAAV